MLEYPRDAGCGDGSPDSSVSSTGHVGLAVGSNVPELGAPLVGRLPLLVGPSGHVGALVGSMLVGAGVVGRGGPGNSFSGLGVGDIVGEGDEGLTLGTADGAATGIFEGVREGPIVGISDNLEGYILGVSDVCDGKNEGIWDNGVADGATDGDSDRAEG